MQELASAHACLMEDAKNYHVWAHRQVVVQLAGLWEAELEYAGHVIQDDVRNNSAWNQRHFALCGLNLQCVPRTQRLVFCGSQDQTAEWAGSIRVCCRSLLWRMLGGAVHDVVAG